MGRNFNSAFLLAIFGALLFGAVAASAATFYLTSDQGRISLVASSEQTEDNATNLTPEPPAVGGETMDETPATTSSSGATPETPEPAVDYEAFLAGLGLVAAAPPVEGDVTGDGHAEVLLSAHAPDCGSCHARTFFVMDGSNILFSASGEGWLEPTASGVIFEWISPLRIPGEGLCCPSWFAVESYRWDGTGFRLGENVRLRHFLEVNDMPVTGQLEPPRQLATVVLFYTLLDRERYAQAFNLFSDAAQHHYHYEGWAAGYQDTQSIVVEMASTVGTSDLIGVRLQSTQATASGPTTTTFEGTWKLVEEDGRWLLDSSNIQALGQ